MTLFDNQGELKHEMAARRCEQLGDTIEDNLKCLADMDVSAAELRAYAHILMMEVGTAVETILFNRAMDIAEQEGSKEADSDFNGPENKEGRGA
jgi:hypothetical protein